VLLLVFTRIVTGDTSRTRIDLCGIWDILPDSNETGVHDRWYEPGHKGDWQTIAVPSSWETVLGTDFDGVAWYRKQFRISKGGPENHVLLRFHGAATEARVWVNGREAGRHTGPWTPFTLDVTQMVEPGEPAEVVVRLDEKVGHSTQGFLPIIAPHFGGLWQGVEVLLVRSAWVDDTRIPMDAAEIDVEDGTGILKVSVPINGRIPNGARLRFALVDGGRVLPGSDVVSAMAEVVTWQWQGKVNFWAAGKPNLVQCRIELLGPDSEVLDVVHRRVGFRRATAKGPQILLNEEPLVIRGVLTWGYYPPLLAPSPDIETFRKQLRYFRSCGFNLIKFCLWLPPQTLLDVMDEEGMLSWIEYPTWHTKIDREHGEDLLREYAELSHHDGDHPSVILRSITCETGPSADLQVLRDIYNLLKVRCPGTLVEDDSSWIAWNRIHDFWDDHAYGNNRTWRGTLRSLKDYIHEHGVKPFLLGEAIFADTWADTGRLLSECADARPWWLPRWLDDQLVFERDLEQRFTQPGFSPVKDLSATSLKYAMDMRRWQMETFRDQMPDSGYVISVIRDMRLCNMGLIDNADQPKWDASSWAFHSALMTPLLTPGDQRAFRCVPEAKLQFDSRLRITEGSGAANRCQVTWQLGPAASRICMEKEIDQTLGPDGGGNPAVFHVREHLQKPTRVTLTREISKTQTSESRVEWEFWALPDPAPVPSGLVIYGDPGDRELDRLFSGAARLAQGQAVPASTPAIVTCALSEPVMVYLEQGGRVLHLTLRQRAQSWRIRSDGPFRIRNRKCRWCRASRCPRHSSLL
jgi:hypothetical protein